MPGCSAEGRLRVDPRWDEAVRLVLREMAGDSTPTRSAVLRKAAARLGDELHGDGVVPRPSPATAYRRLAELTKGTNAVSRKPGGPGSIAAGPRALRAAAGDAAGRVRRSSIPRTWTCSRWSRSPAGGCATQLTIAQDLFTRCGYRAAGAPRCQLRRSTWRASSTRRSCRSQAPADWPPEACWAYHGVPQQLVLTEEAGLPGVPVCPPETLVIDHGKAFLSAHVIGVCTGLGISIPPARPERSRRISPRCERFFRTLREGLIQHLPAYKGPDVYSRGERVEDSSGPVRPRAGGHDPRVDRAGLHRVPHDGLAVPEWPHLKLSPNEMFEAGVAQAGLLRIPAAPGLAYEFLPKCTRAPFSTTGWRSAVCVTTALRWTPTATAQSPHGGAAGRQVAGAGQP